MRHPVRGLLIGPLIVPFAYWVGVLAHASVRDSRFDGLRALRELAVIIGFGLPISYAAALAWGAPVLYALHRLGWLRIGPTLLAGAMGGTIVAALIALEQQGSMIRIHMPLAGGAVLGALAAGACWWAGGASASPRPEREPD